MKATNILIALGILLAIVTTTSFAYDLSIYGFDWENSCKNTTHLFRQADVWVNDSLLTFNQTIQCSSGCSNSTLECLPTDMSMNFWLIGITFLILLMIVLGIKLDIVVGLPMLMISVVLTSYFITMDFFTSTYQLILGVFVLLEILSMYYVLTQMRKDEDD